MTILLQGVVGSVAYGLAGPDSDRDHLGIYAAPTTDFHGLRLPSERELSIVEHEPEDAAWHEAGKACRLMLAGNPTVTEILWLDSYEIHTPLGAELIAIRSAFLCAKRTRDAYFGYATSQLHRLVETGQFKSKMRKRSEKHGRHLRRLLDQGFALYATGVLPIRVDDPQRYLEFGERVANDPEVARAALAEATERFDSVRSPLPDEPNAAAVEAWLRRVRAAFYDGPEPTRTQTEFEVRWHRTGDDEWWIDNQRVGDLDEASEVGPTGIGMAHITRWTVWQRERRFFADRSSWTGPWRKVEGQPS